MREGTRRELMRRLVAALDDPSREVPRRSTALSVDRYVDTDQLEREHRAIFRRRPLAVAHASELAEPGSWATESVAGVPLLVVRDAEGTARTFVKLPSEERHGFVWVRLDGSPVDAASFLGPVLDDDFEAFALEEHVVVRRTERVKRANWKLVFDAFAEGYHLKSLHARSLARFFLELAILDDCAPHVRQVGARKALLEARDDEASWDLRRHTADALLSGRGSADRAQRVAL